MKRRLRIAILTHSTNPRGGVVHALELGDALCRLGHEATVHAPDASGAGFFRDTLCATVAVAASPVGRDITAMVETRDRRLRPPFRTGRASRLRRLARPGRHFRQCAGDAEGARPDRGLRPHRASRRQFRGSAARARCRRARSRPPIVCSWSAGCGATGWRANSAAARDLDRQRRRYRRAFRRWPTQPTPRCAAISICRPARRCFSPSAASRSARTRFASSKRSAAVACGTRRRGS